jgi:DNA-binding NarL/FixJ family response regulator
MKIVVADDHAIVRDGVRVLLLDIDSSVTVLEAESCAEAKALCDGHPDVELVVLDLGMPGEPCRVPEFMERYAARVVILSATEDNSVILGMLNAGVAGYIPKSMNTRVMRHALKYVLAGGVYVPPQVLAVPPGGQPASPSVVEPAPVAAGGELSERQMAVLRMLGAGCSNKEIARELDISPHTVKDHVAAISRALNARSRGKAVHEAIRLGLLAPQ